MAPRQLSTHATPTKERDGRSNADFHGQLVAFSRKYNLDLRLSDFDRTSSPRKNKDADPKLRNQLHCAYWNYNLQLIFDQFDNEVTEVRRNHATPPFPNVSQATSEAEQRSSLDCLVAILNNNAIPNVSASRTSASPLTDESPKRRLDKCLPHILPSPEKSRSSIADDGSLLDSDIFLKKAGDGINRPTDSSRSHITLSGNTSTTTIDSGMFDDPQPASPDTQITTEASTQERLTLHQEEPSSSDDFALSSGTDWALEQSFNVCTAFGEQEAVNPEISTCEPASSENSGTLELEERLSRIWPHLPSYLDLAPIAVRWEVLRIALHCNVSLDELGIVYDKSWDDQNHLWSMFKELLVLRGKSMPPKSRPEAWTASLANFRTAKQVVVLSASFTTNSTTKGPIFLLQLNPLQLEFPHRLSRRFGSDRFLEINFPSISSSSPARIKALGQSGIEMFIRWLVGSHIFLARKWSPFFVKPAAPKKAARVDQHILGPEPKPINQDRVYMFAEDGDDMQLPEDRWSRKDEGLKTHTRMTRESLLEWLLQTPQNTHQPLLKLFSRIALGLSRTRPAIVLEPNQIRHRSEDIFSPSGNVMNNGIARISPALARDISNALNLDYIPSGFQARFGSAKGVWIVDVQDASDDVWIETYPSQRKWECDFGEVDHRTFEVRRETHELKPATLSLQLLPILEDRAIHSSAMKTKVGQILRNGLLTEFENQKSAMQDPTQFRRWVHENAVINVGERVEGRQISFVAGLPKAKEDKMAFLLDSGFTIELQFLREIAYTLRRQKCEELQKRLNIKLDRSTNALMVIDFLGVLEENEVHLGFSSSFHDSHETFLHGIDVLVARNPAHFASDIQRVKAVFKPELGRLKDVIVFSSKGNKSLAESLSGGDFDGDIAWVCWEPSIVENFQSISTPPMPDLFKGGILSKNTELYHDLIKGPGSSALFLEKAFSFNMQRNHVLGSCTNYKEKLCYARKSVRDGVAIMLSTLISKLVDRPKQGIILNEQRWARLRNHLNGKGRPEPPLPQYRGEHWNGEGRPTHIIDYLKFTVGKPAVEYELQELDKFLKQKAGDDSNAAADEDLVRVYKHYATIAHDGNDMDTVLGKLKKDLSKFCDGWAKQTTEEMSFEAKLERIYPDWLSISPSPKVEAESDTVWQLSGPKNSAFPPWDLLKASLLFSEYHRPFRKLVWAIAGRQLAHIKASTLKTNPSATLAPPALVVPSMYAGFRPDTKYARALAARDKGRFVETGEGEDWRDDDA